MQEQLTDKKIECCICHEEREEKEMVPWHKTVCERCFELYNGG